jgi:hypothetical protein
MIRIANHFSLAAAQARTLQRSGRVMRWLIPAERLMEANERASKGFLSLVIRF